MKNITITVKKDDVKSVLVINKMFAGLFALIIIYYAFSGGNSIYYFAPFFGLIVSFMSIYSNNKALKIKGSIVSKTTAGIDIFKRSILVNKIAFVLFLVIFVLIDLALLIGDIEYFFGMFPFTLLALYGIRVRYKMLSNSLKKK